MPGLGAFYRYFGALSLVCKLLKTSGLQFSLQESCKLFTVYSQKWLTETHTRSGNDTFTSLLLSKCEGGEDIQPKAPVCLLRTWIRMLRRDVGSC